VRRVLLKLLRVLLVELVLLGLGMGMSMGLGLCLCLGLGLLLEHLVVLGDELLLLLLGEHLLVLVHLVRLRYLDLDLRYLLDLLCLSLLLLLLHRRLHRLLLLDRGRRAGQGDSCRRHLGRDGLLRHLHPLALVGLCDLRCRDRPRVAALAPPLGRVLDLGMSVAL
jgi:hypothetical protein